VASLNCRLGCDVGEGNSMSTHSRLISTATHCRS
jgi:hypothetical protein